MICKLKNIQFLFFSWKCSNDHQNGIQVLMGNVTSSAQRLKIWVNLHDFVSWVYFAGLVSSLPERHLVPTSAIWQTINRGVFSPQA